MVALDEDGGIASESKRPVYEYRYTLGKAHYKDGREPGAFGVRLLPDNPRHAKTFSGQGWSGLERIDFDLAEYTNLVQAFVASKGEETEGYVSALVFIANELRGYPGIDLLAMYSHDLELERAKVARAVREKPGIVFGRLMLAFTASPQIFTNVVQLLADDDKPDFRTEFMLYVMNHEHRPRDAQNVRECLCIFLQRYFPDTANLASAAVAVQSIQFDFASDPGGDRVWAALEAQFRSARRMTEAVELPADFSS